MRNSYQMIKINRDCSVDVEMQTITDTKLQYNDLVIQYLSKENQIVIYFDCKDSQLRYIYQVQKKGRKVYFKINNCFPFGLRLTDIKNLEIKQL